MKMTYLNVYLHCFVIDELIFIPNPMCQIYKFLLTHDEKKSQNEMPHIGEFSVDSWVAVNNATQKYWVTYLTITVFKI